MKGVRVQLEFISSSVGHVFFDWAGGTSSGTIHRHIVHVHSRGGGGVRVLHDVHAFSGDQRMRSRRSTLEPKSAIKLKSQLGTQKQCDVSSETSRWLPAVQHEFRSMDGS